MWHIIANETVGSATWLVWWNADTHQWVRDEGNATMFATLADARAEGLPLRKHVVYQELRDGVVVNAIAGS